MSKKKAAAALEEARQAYVRTELTENKTVGPNVKYTIERAKAAVEAVELAGTVAAAAAGAGVSRRAISNWRKRFPEFDTRIAEARAVFEYTQLKRIGRAGENPRHWTASAWLLERMFPERYSLVPERFGTEKSERIPTNIAVMIQQHVVAALPAATAVPDPSPVVVVEPRELPAPPQEKELEPFTEDEDDDVDLSLLF